MDIDDLDSDPAIDSILLLNWLDLNGNWPGINTTPATLYTAEFTTSGDFAATTINFTAKTVPGLELDAQPVSIGAQVVNQAPTLNDATFSLAENSGVGTAVGTVTATDPDAGDTLTYSIESGAFTIDTATGAITVADSSQLDFETTTSFPLTVTVTDQGALSDTCDSKSRSS